MAFDPIDTAQIQVGKALVKEILQKTKDNFDDHEARIAANETANSSMTIFDETVYCGSIAATLTNLLQYKAKVALRITKVEVQIYTKGGISSGSLTIDLKKNSSLNPVGFATIMSVLPTINYATASDYDANSGTINAALNELAIGDFIQLDVTALPAAVVPKFRLVVTAEII